MKLAGFIKPHRLGPGWIKSTRPDPTQIAQILELGFENVLPGHGEPVLGDAPEKYRPAVQAYVQTAG